ncbi:hypothetical protein MVES_003178 [Malassezia vespertilionis]|uniref:Uncharacterized protein n=1 Tax=Malassezia vespertilionis TaxID=2020962 RepID=A0A2N1J882_9BASI|nr:hypothetical protein MVES_003178 [Malassezia vespertilionis]
MSASDAPVYHPRSPVGAAFNAAGFGAVSGLLMSAVQNSLQKHKGGAMGIFTRTGSTIALFRAFGYVDASVANSRNKSDAWNGAAGGCASGLVIGAASSCVGLGALIGTFQAAGSELLNQRGLKPKPVAEKPDPESPLLASSQERRINFFK